MGFDHRLSCDARLKPETTVEQVVEALSPLLDDFGFSREKVAAALHNAGKFNYGSSEDDHIQYDPETGSLEFWTCGHVSGDFPEAVSQTAQRLGPLSDAAGYLLLQDHDTANLDEAQTEFFFGPSKKAIADHRFQMDLSAAGHLLATHLPEDAVTRLLDEARVAYHTAKLAPYRVMLHEDRGDKFQIVFDCMAEDEDHAVEQAENAYPGCEIVSCLPDPERLGAGALPGAGGSPTDNRKPEATVTLGVFDSKGDMVGTAAKTLTLDAVEDIVDHATQLVLVRRDGSDEDAMNVVTGELEEALVVAGIIGES